MSIPPPRNCHHRHLRRLQAPILVTIPPTPPDEIEQPRISEESLSSYKSRASYAQDEHRLRVPRPQRRPSPLRMAQQSQSSDDYTSSALRRRSTRHVEEGCDEPARSQGVLANMLDLYSSKADEAFPMSAASSRARSLDSAAENNMATKIRSRSSSIMSTETDLGMLFDEHDPRITGIRNRIDDKRMTDLDEARFLDDFSGDLTREKRKEKVAIERNLKRMSGPSI